MELNTTRFLNYLKNEAKSISDLLSKVDIEKYRVEKIIEKNLLQYPMPQLYLNRLASIKYMVNFKTIHNPGDKRFNKLVLEIIDKLNCEKIRYFLIE